jgi:hypothetical protein
MIIVDQNLSPRLTRGSPPNISPTLYKKTGRSPDFSVFGLRNAIIDTIFTEKTQGYSPPL